MHEMIRAGARELRAATWQLFTAGPRLIHGSSHPALKQALLEGFTRGERQLARLDRVCEIFPPAPGDFSDVVGGWLAELWISRTREWSLEERDASTTIALKHILSYLDQVYTSTIELCQASSRGEIAEALAECAREVHAAHAPLTAVLADLLTRRRSDAYDPDATPAHALPLVPRRPSATVGELRRAGNVEEAPLAAAGW